MSKTPLEAPEEYLLSLPPRLSLDVKRLAAAQSLGEFTQSLPLGPPRECLREALRICRDRTRSFFLEGALDRGYFRELLARTEPLSNQDKELIRPIVCQEVDAFHLMLVVRGRFHYGLTPEMLLSLYVPRSRISRERFSNMLAATDGRAVAGLALGRAIDALPLDPQQPGRPPTYLASALETLVTQRFLHLSNRAFRCSHMGLAAVIGYVGIRRVEVANLITFSQGLVDGAAPDTLRAHLFPHTDLEAAHV